jgi:hypothetical protein
MSKHVVLPDEREAKLKELAQAHDVSVAEAVGILIGWAIEAGKLQPGIPSIDVYRDAEQIVVDFSTFKREFEPDVAAAFATGLRHLSRPKTTLGLDVIEAFSGLATVGLMRRGTSIKVLGPAGEERALAPSVARELADLITSTLAS